MICLGAGFDTEKADLGCPRALSIIPDLLRVSLEFPCSAAGQHRASQSGLGNIMAGKGLQVGW